MLLVIGTDCIGSDISNYYTIYDHDVFGNSVGVDQNFIMAISHGQGLHCSFMGNSLLSLGEALKTMNSI